MFIMKTILFMGSSLHDVDLKLVLESVNEAFEGKGPRHYAFVPAKECSEAEEIHWRDFFGIYVMKYEPSEGHPEVEEFLRNLRAKIADRKKAKAALLDDRLGWSDRVSEKSPSGE